MIDGLTFMMGEFEAPFPVDRMYAKNHMWAQFVDDEANEAGARRLQFGFTAYAVRLLQDVYFLDWLVDAPSELKDRQEFGSIESKKAESALYAPAVGKLLQFNELLMDDPSAINTDKYGKGWLFEMELTNPVFLSPTEYVALLDDVWATTQRTIKGQI